MRSRRLILVFLFVIGAAGAATVGALAFRPARDVTTRSDTAWGYYQDGLQAMQKFYDTEARGAWEMALEEDPEFAMAAARLARMSLAFGDLASAQVYGERAAGRLDALTDRERLHIQLIGADLANDKPRKRAIEAELLVRFPDDPEILLLAGTHALDEGRAAQALPLLQKVLRVDPSYGEAYNLLGYTFAALGRWKDAAVAFQKYVFLYPEQANPHDSLGEMYLRIGRYPEALRQFDRALELKPDFSWALYHRATTLSELGRHDAAMASIHRAFRRGRRRIGRGPVEPDGRPPPPAREAVRGRPAGSGRAPDGLPRRRAPARAPGAGGVCLGTSPGGARGARQPAGRAGETRPDVGTGLDRGV